MRWLAITLTLTACAAGEPIAQNAPEASTPPAGAGQCDASELQQLVGETVSQSLGADAMRRAGAETLRWIPEGSAVTMDYREDRLNISYDDQNRITRIHCG